jgi:hypothetical protein
MRLDEWELKMKYRICKTKCRSTWCKRGVDGDSVSVDGG